MKKIVFILIILLPCGFNKIMAQSVSINDTGNPPNSFSVLDLDCSFNDKGLLIPRLTTLQRTSILGLTEAEEGLTVYDETVDSYFLWNGSTWLQFAMGSAIPWNITGNSVTQGTHFVGTTNDAYLSLRTNNTERVRITTKGQIETRNTGYSVFIGQYAGNSDDLFMGHNVFIGFRSGLSNTSGYYNTATGDESLLVNTIGIENTASGVQALSSNSEGSSNTASGAYALNYNTTGSFNTALGALAGYSITTGNFNTCIGFNSYLSASDLDNATAIGNGAIASASNQVRLGNSDVSSLYCKGAYTATTSNTPNLYVASDGQIMRSIGNDGTANWLLTGNAGTVAGTNFLGTTDARSLDFRTNDLLKVRITTDGRIETYNTGYSVFIGESSGLWDDLSDNYNVFIGHNAGSNNIKGENNTAIGNSAFNGNRTGGRNIAMGDSALYSQSFNNTMLSWISNNVAVGNKALYSNQPNTTSNGIKNTAIGNDALRSNTTGYCNTALGYQAGNSIVTGSYNTCIGYDADVSVNNLSNVTAIGNGAIAVADNQVRLGNMAVTTFFCQGAYAAATSNAPNLYVAPGGQIMRSTYTGSGNSWSLTGNAGTVAGTNFLGTTDNQGLDFRTNNILRTRITTKGQIETFNTGNSVFIGQGAGNSDDLSFNLNVFIGYRAGYSNTSGTYNIACGDSSLFFNTTGAYNTASGSKALRSNETGYFNTAYGSAALMANTTAYHNTAIGTTTLRFNTSGGYNTAVGSAALQYNTTGDYNTASGYGALYANTTGSRNTANGENALKSNTTAGQNVAMGSFALYTQSFNNGGSAWTSNNVAIGFEALYSNQPTSTTNGYWNTATGTFALRSNTIGSFNTASGVSALRTNTTGNSNTACGVEVLYSNTTGVNNTASGVSALYDNTTGSYNTATGSAALRLNTTGSSNTATGYQALFSNTTGFNNTAIGYYAGSNITTGSNNIALGHGADVLNGANSNQIRIGNLNIAYAAVQVAWTIGSDQRWKSEIQPSNLGLDFICKLQPVSYKRTNDESHKREYGFIAQDLSQSLNEAGACDNGMISQDSEGMYGVRYNDLLAPIVKAIQELKAENENLQKRIADLEEMINQ